MYGGVFARFIRTEPALAAKAPGTARSGDDHLRAYGRGCAPTERLNNDQAGLKHRSLVLHGSRSAEPDIEQVWAHTFMTLLREHFYSRPSLETS